MASLLLNTSCVSLGERVEGVAFKQRHLAFIFLYKQPHSLPCPESDPLYVSIPAPRPSEYQMVCVD